MKRFAALSIRWKLTLASMLASLTVMTIVSGAFFAHAMLRARADLERALQMRGEILGHVSAASILFKDPKTAADILDALRPDPRIIAAAIFSRNRQPLASYRRDSAEGDAIVRLESALPDEHRFDADRLLVAHRIEFKGEQIGFVVLESDLSDLRDLLWRSTIVFLLVLLVCGGIGSLLAARLQRVVSRPILALVESARTISRDRDYSVRVAVRGEDELGILALGFNEMLDQIERRDAELERRVAERTHALSVEIAERRQAQAALLRQTEELTRSNADLEQFAYVASHDLQEPLRMVASYTQLLAETQEHQLGQEAREYIRYAVDGAVRMQALIGDLLAYARVARAETALRPVDSRHLLSQALDNLKVALEESGGRVVVDDLPPVVGNPSQLIQLFQNLVGNALKFRGERPPEIHVGAVLREGETEFSVRDNGIGFDAKYATRIFVIFQRLHARGTYPGTGIGLAVCKKIVERHGGRIWVQSVPGAGTTFFFTVPEAHPSPQEKEEVHHVRVAR